MLDAPDIMDCVDYFDLMERKTTTRDYFPGCHIPYTRIYLKPKDVRQCPICKVFATHLENMKNRCDIMCPACYKEIMEG